MMYVIGIVMLAMATLYSGYKHAASQATKYKGERDVAVAEAQKAIAANATLAKQIPPIKAQCEAATLALNALTVRDNERAAKSKVAKDKAATSKIAQQSKLDSDLFKIAGDVTTKWEVACADATSRLGVLSADRLRQQAERDHVGR